MAEESRYTHIKFLLNGAGDEDIAGDDTVSIHESSGEEDKETIVNNMRSTCHLVKTAMKSRHYDQITTIISGPHKKASKGQYEETVELCKEMDGLLKDFCEVGKKEGYTIIMVGTNGDCAAVLENPNARSKCVDVPCFIVPAEGSKYERQESR